MPPAHLIDWRGKDWTPASETPAAHPNARFTVAAAQDPAIARSGRTPRACRSRRSCSADGARPWCRWSTEAFDWEHGVFLGATMGSEKTAAAAGTVGELRFDPFAMLPFCGYNMADYFAHWLQVGREADTRSCRRSSTSTGSARTPTASSCGPATARTRACWRGSSRAAPVTARLCETPIGHMPPVGPDGLDTRGLDISDEDIAELLRVDVAEWKAQLPALPRAPRQVRSPAEGAARAAAGARAAAVLLSSPLKLQQSAQGGDWRPSGRCRYARERPAC